MTPRNEYADYFGDLAYLQLDEPVRNAEYVLSPPNPDDSLRYEPRQIAEARTKETEDSRVDRFTADELKPIHPEPAMPSFGESPGSSICRRSTAGTVLGAGTGVSSKINSTQTRKPAVGIAHCGFRQDRNRKSAGRLRLGRTEYTLRCLEFGVYGYKPHRAVQTITRAGVIVRQSHSHHRALEESGNRSALRCAPHPVTGDLASSVASLAF